MPQTQERYAEKIANLLAKAESTEFEAEREAAMRAAQHLMERYAIDEALVARARGEQQKEREEVTRALIKCTGRYRVPEVQLAVYIAEVNHCKAIYRSGWDRLEDKKTKSVWVNGFESDVSRVEMLHTSLTVQAHAAMRAWWKTEAPEYLKKTRQGFYARRDFMFGFARGVQEQLRLAVAEARTEAEEAEVERSEVTAEEASESVTLVLREREEVVQEWIDEKYGKLGTYRGGSYRGGGAGARSAGASAGRRADTRTGGTEIRGGSRRALPA